MERITLEQITTQMVEDKMKEVGLDGIFQIDLIVENIITEALKSITFSKRGVNPECLTLIALETTVWGMRAEKIGFK